MQSECFNHLGPLFNIEIWQTEEKVYIIICFHTRNRENMSLLGNWNQTKYQNHLKALKIEQPPSHLVLSIHSTLKQKNNRRACFIVSAEKSIKRQKEANQRQRQIPGKGEKQSLSKYMFMSQWFYLFIFWEEYSQGGRIFIIYRRFSAGPAVLDSNYCSRWKEINK